MTRTKLICVLLAACSFCFAAPVQSTYNSRVFIDDFEGYAVPDPPGYVVTDDYLAVTGYLDDNPPPSATLVADWEQYYGFPLDPNGQELALSFGQRPGYENIYASDYGSFLIYPTNRTPAKSLFDLSMGMMWMSADLGFLADIDITGDQNYLTPESMVKEVFYVIYVDTDNDGDPDVFYQSSVGAPIPIDVYGVDPETVPTWSSADYWTKPYGRRYLDGDEWNKYAIDGTPLGTTFDIPESEHPHITTFGIEFTFDATAYAPLPADDFLEVYMDNFTFAVIPEPATFGLLAIMAYVSCGRKSRRRS